jgi:hypothetical protein
MRWSCPHCGTHLAVAEDRLGTGWSFSRCFKCSGYALIRRAEVNVIKVHGAPTGERILSTESHDQTLMSQKSIETLGNFVTSGPQAHSNSQMISSATAGFSASANAAAGASAAGQPTWVAQNSYPPINTATHTFGIPNALPELPEPGSKFGFSMPAFPKLSLDLRARLLPAAIVVAGVTTVSSGIYFYLQGRELLNRASNPPASRAIQPASVTAQPQIGAGAAAAPAHAPGSNRDQALEAAASRISDQVRAQAMAPIRQSAPIAPSAPVTPVRSSEFSAAAPAILQMIVQPAIPNAKIRSGPGIDYSLVGVADPDTRYTITAWQDRWFKIKAKTSAAAVTSPQPEGWIRNDLVRTITSE